MHGATLAVVGTDFDHALCAVGFMGEREAPVVLTVPSPPPEMTRLPIAFSE